MTKSFISEPEANKKKSYLLNFLTLFLSHRMTASLNSHYTYMLRKKDFTKKMTKLALTKKADRISCSIVTD